MEIRAILQLHFWIFSPHDCRFTPHRDASDRDPSVRGTALLELLRNMPEFAEEGKRELAKRIGKLEIVSINACKFLH
jgi:hypothetical protein